MIALIALWSHLLAAALYGALAIWQLRHWQGDPRSRPLVSAFFVTAVWAIFLALLGPYHILSQLSEAARNLAFLSFMYGIVRAETGGDERLRAVRAVYAAVAAVVGLQIVIGGVLPEFRDAPAIFAALTSTIDIVSLTIAAGALVLVHNFYGQAAPASRWGIHLPAMALAAMWAYDLHLHTVSYLSREPAAELLAMRGAMLAMLVPLFALAIRRNANWKVQISRAATFQSLSLTAIFAYLLVMMSASRAMEALGGGWGRLAQIGVILVMTLAAFVLLPSGRARAWLRVFTAKHLFAHRYDYREEWLRFTGTIGRGGEDCAPIEERAIKALADIADSPSGLLLLADGEGRFSVGASWNWRGPMPGPAEEPGFARFLSDTGHIVDFAAARSGPLIQGDRSVPTPAWLAGLEGAWAGVPLIHGERLAGLVVLEHPLVRRPLDWEDYDLFRAAGMQAASHIAEAASARALAEARRFDEFNRRFAFIMHDIKNLVSQLSLVARNAERHADNPEFRADMIATLQGSVKKMNDLLARLSRGSAGDPQPPRAVELRPLVASIVAPRARHHRITVSGAPGLAAFANPSGIEQALSHLVQNAVEASGGEEVSVGFAACGDEVRIEIADRGHGMSADFVRDRLFQPFASTKEGGFGIGAYEARALVEAMGGRLEVDSREGEGTRFAIILPRAELPALEPQRMRA